MTAPRQTHPAGLAAYLVFVFAAAVAVYSFVTIAKDGERRRKCSPLCLIKPAYAAADRSVPDFELPDWNGRKVSITSYRGKVVFLNLWTKTCGPCMKEMVDIAELARLMQGRKDVAVITISADDGPDDVRESLQAALKLRRGGLQVDYPVPPFPVLFDPEMKVIGDRLGTKLFPETWLIDRKGVIRARVDGGRPWSDALAVELIDSLSQGDYCPVRVSEGRTTGEATGICEEIAGP